jgi:DNA-binding transcriptional ArsR family regulator
VPSPESVRKSPQDVSAMTPADTAATSRHDPVDMALPPGAPDTAVTRALWAALAAHVTATAAELASTAGVSRSTTNKTLAALEEAGLATRTAGAREGTQRLPDQWQAVIELEPAVPEPTEASDTTIDVRNHIESPVSDQHDGAHRDEATEPSEAMAADLPKRDSTAPPVPATIKVRLGAGQLRDMVLVHLREHSDQDHTASATGKVLARSSGAIANACEKLAREGAIAQTSERPRKYRFVDRA